MNSIEPREFLTQVFAAGVAAADPRRVTRQAVATLEDVASPVWVFATGKGAHAMASGAIEALSLRNVPVAGGFVVANEHGASATHGLEPWLLESMIGDHPTPGASSFAAAQRLSAIAERTTADSDAIVLVSGGTSSLIAGPVHGISENDLRQAFATLLASGADIGLMNAIRKRLLRFGAGRLALALNSRRVHCLIASDVIGNDPASIASGPCVPDSGTARDARERARKAGAWDSLPERVRALIDAMADGRVPDVPPADHPRFTSTSVRIILDRTDAERGAAEFARSRGAAVEVRAEPLSGEASSAGRHFAEQLLGRQRGNIECIIWSGEPTVNLGAASGQGGRCQEFALACALRLEEPRLEEPRLEEPRLEEPRLDEAGLERSSGITILAAGTDGRDGPTDAAGAIIDANTCERMRAQGIDPLEALRTHASYDALQAVNSLLKTGPTGTNVNDLVIAFVA